MKIASLLGISVPMQAVVSEIVQGFFLACCGAPQPLANRSPHGHNGVNIALDKQYMISYFFVQPVGLTKINEPIPPSIHSMWIGESLQLSYCIMPVGSFMLFPVSAHVCEVYSKGLLMLQCFVVLEKALG